MTEIEKVCKNARDSAIELSNLNSNKKNKMLNLIIDVIKNNAGEILSANKIDVINAQKNNMPTHFIDRLTLNQKRLDGIIEGIKNVISLSDPIGEVMETFTPKNGLKITKKRVPVGVIGVIYEARPNVTFDVIALTIKSGNCVVLRGGSDTINSNKKIVGLIKEAFKNNGFNPEYIQLLIDTTREGVLELMKLNKYIDLLIPRGGKSLIESVVKNSTVPVIETGSGNCHVYVHKDADLDMALKILINAKCARVSVCNAAESLLVDKEIAQKFLKTAKAELEKNNVKILGCKETIKIINCQKATDEDFYTEFDDYIISVKVVESLTGAIAHINKYGTKHSDCIVTNDKAAAKEFFNNIDSAAVYHNASTYFTDGFQFGFGAEIGISTQKIHARGPMGLKELTSYKYIVEGNGNIRV